MALIRAATIGLDRAIQRQTAAQQAAREKYAPKTSPGGLVMPSTRQVVKANTLTERVNGSQLTDRQLKRMVSKQANGARILDLLHKILSYWARWEEPEWIDMTALWIMHTWFIDDEGVLVFPATPRWLAIAKPGSGKSRLLELIAALVYECEGLNAGVVTAPYVRELLDKHRTVVLDEIHRVFKSGLAMQDLQAILTSGYRPSGKSGNARGGMNTQSNFGPVAMGAQPKITESRDSDMLEDLFQRSFIFYPVKHTDPDDTIPEIDTEEFEAAIEMATTGLSFFAAQNVPEDGKKLFVKKDKPRELTGRKWEIAQPLIAVGDLAVDQREEFSLSEIGAGTGVVPMTDDYRYRWADRARDAALFMLTQHGNTQRITKGVEDMLAKLDELGA